MLESIHSCINSKFKWGLAQTKIYLEETREKDFGLVG